MVNIRSLLMVLTEFFWWNFKIGVFIFSSLFFHTITMIMMLDIRRPFLFVLILWCKFGLVKFFSGFIPSSWHTNHGIKFLVLMVIDLGYSDSSSCIRHPYQILTWVTCQFGSRACKIPWSWRIEHQDTCLHSILILIWVTQLHNYSWVRKSFSLRLGLGCLILFDTSNW